MAVISNTVLYRSRHQPAKKRLSVEPRFGIRRWSRVTGGRTQEDWQIPSRPRPARGARGANRDEHRESVTQARIVVLGVKRVAQHTHDGFLGGWRIAEGGWRDTSSLHMAMSAKTELRMMWSVDYVLRIVNRGERFRTASFNKKHEDLGYLAGLGMSKGKLGLRLW